MEKWEEAQQYSGGMDRAAARMGYAVVIIALESALVALSGTPWSGALTFIFGGESLWLLLAGADYARMRSRLRRLE